jgi:hypothetical protein
MEMATVETAVKSYNNPTKTENSSEEYRRQFVMVNMM